MGRCFKPEMRIPEQTGFSEEENPRILAGGQEINYLFIFKQHSLGGI